MPHLQNFPSPITTFNLSRPQFPSLHPLNATLRLYTTSTMSIESAKRLAAYRAVSAHFSPNYTHVGIGSGSTIKYVVDAIAEVIRSQTTSPNSLSRTSTINTPIQFVPTGYQSRQVILSAGLAVLLYDQLPENITLDVAFDGADEVDSDLNCIKGGGACLFQEKLVAQRARKFICVADFRKAQHRLLTAWPSIPIEVAPIAAPSVLIALCELGSVDPQIRLNPLAKSGPLKTDQDFYIIDAPFPNPLNINEDRDGNGWDVAELATRIRDITGVLEVGLFCGFDGAEAEEKREAKGKGQKPVAVYFGMEDGSVMVRVRKGGLPGVESGVAA